MGEEQEISNVEAYSSSNEGYDNANVLQIRLNTEPLIDKAVEYLSGEKIVPNIDEKGNPIFSLLKVAKPKANKEGVHSIMIWLSGILNPSMVQGNIETFSEKDNKVADFREDFSEYLMKNLIKWDVDEDEFEGIVDIVVTQMDLFLSRLVGNKERDSYQKTIEHKENSNTQVKGGGFKIPGF